MPISDEINRIIMQNGNAIEIAQQARREGVKDLRQSGLLKVKQGVTSLEEVEGVTNE
jgi:type IV pilus assembly protein PilB